MDIKICPKCQAKWIDGNLFWSTGASGKESDLAGLVCDNLSDETCINPLKGTEHGGDTWKKRMAFLDKQDLDPQ